MSDRKNFDRASQDFADDLAALRDDISKLTGTVSGLVRGRAGDAADQASNYYGRARDRARKQAYSARDSFADRASGLRDDLSDRASDLRDGLADRASDVRDRFAGHASDAQDRLGAFGSDMETKIERNPLTAVVVAAIAGLLMGLLSRSF